MRADAAHEVVNTVMAAVREAFDPASEFPPVGGGSTTVRFFGGDGLPIEAWDAHADGTDCGDPFLWVRLARRYRTTAFPTPSLAPSPCGSPVALVIEVGVGRCAVVGAQPTWEDYETEAEISLDDSWRVELALCRAASVLTSSLRADNTAIDAVVPYGPEGGVIAWLGSLYVQL